MFTQKDLVFILFMDVKLLKCLAPKRRKGKKKIGSGSLNPLEAISVVGDCSNGSLLLCLHVHNRNQKQQSRIKTQISEIWRTSPTSSIRLL